MHTFIAVFDRFLVRTLGLIVPGVFLWIAPLAAQTASKLGQGTITVTSVTGAVSVSTAGARTSLKQGQVLAPGSTFTSSPTGSATLQFSNGSAIEISPDSVVSVREFRQASFDDRLYRTLGSITTDPSESHTRIDIERGTIGGHVAKLRPESTFQVTTPGGEVRILGTDYVVTVTIDATTGEATTVITNANGEIVAVVNGNPITLPAGNSVAVQATRSVNTAGQVVFTVTSVGTSRPATVAELGIATAAAARINRFATLPLPGGDAPSSGPLANVSSEAFEELVVPLDNIIVSPSS